MAGRRLCRHALICVSACLLTCIAILCLWIQESGKDLCLAIGGVFRPPAVMVPAEKYVLDKDHRKYVYSREMPLVFIGGMPRSGTTLLRVLPRPPQKCEKKPSTDYWDGGGRGPLESPGLKEAGITPQVLDSAVAAFTLEIIARHGDPAYRLCNKDPFSLRSSVYLHSLFPNAKFILMLRDGRAVVHSIISRKVGDQLVDVFSFSIYIIQSWTPNL
ncbi:protein-tyrosine sulfotransferase [Trichonephila inaurata madagascariensis]|uniref:Protein-tyrosine sulfotransferase n=1 Tax=Trichonephila inaurata madagascariensis TaxID=2747483 RepID=A0A8X6X737_9ARAC|nr:protein-tyrosine sulfotransferase [Trichonephila inaurata madagascariensis]